MPDLQSELVSYFADRFGVDRSFWEPYSFHEAGKSIWMTSERLTPRESFETAGLRALRRTNLGLKPTTYILQFLGDRLRMNVVRLERPGLRRLVFERETVETELPRGYVALRYAGDVIGCGLVTHGGLETQIPKGRTQALEAVLEPDDG